MVLACFWTKVQAKRSILAPIRAIFDVLGRDRHLGPNLDQGPGLGQNRFSLFRGKKKYGPRAWASGQGLRPVPGLVQVQPQMLVQAQIIKNGPNRVQNRRFGLKLGPGACQGRSKAFGMGLTYSKGPSQVKNVIFIAPL